VRGLMRRWSRHTAAGKMWVSKRKTPTNANTHAHTATQVRTYVHIQTWIHTLTQTHREPQCTPRAESWVRHHEAPADSCKRTMNDCGLLAYSQSNNSQSFIVLREQQYFISQTKNALRTRSNSEPAYVVCNQKQTKVSEQSNSNMCMQTKLNER
jgi:hypothetical protein